MIEKRLKQRGFTLIEVLLSALLFGIIALSIYLVFSQGLRIEKHLRAGVSGGQDFFWSLQRIVRDLERMCPYVRPENGNVYFEGQKNEMVFLISDKEGLKEVRYEVLDPQETQIHQVIVNRDPVALRDGVVVSRQEQEDARYTLVRKQHYFGKNFSESDEGEQEEVLTENIAEEGLVFSYLEIDSDGQEVWQESWQKSTWPRMVRVAMTLLDNNGNTTQVIRDVYIFLGANESGSLSGYE